MRGQCGNQASAGAWPEPALRFFATGASQIVDKSKIVGVLTIEQIPRIIAFLFCSS
uniref:Uncharacterized protein n=1 Tax=Candidozyma auris TaxID=498019 RepID=A0A0L0NQU9_CANAR